MKIRLISIGKTSDSYLKEGMAIYLKRLTHYVDFTILELDEVKGSKNISMDEYRQEEAKRLLPQLKPGLVILLDEKGKEMTSFGFAKFLNEKMLHSTPHIDFVIGGPFGFDDSVRQKADLQLAFSQMTFSHQMIRLFFVEQLYRAMTIIKGEKYHHI